VKCIKREYQYGEPPLLTTHLQSIYIGWDHRINSTIILTPNLHPDYQLKKEYKVLMNEIFPVVICEPRPKDYREMVGKRIKAEEEAQEEGGWVVL
jgi:hypothetical protein